jgi:LacI family transcriptional regulator
VDHLIAQGHRRIAFISGFEAVYTGAERLAGYKAALRAAGIDLEPHLLNFEGHTPDHAEQTALEMLGRPNPPTAIFAASNRQSLGVIRALNRSGHSVALVGFDDFEFADLLPFPITVLRYSAAEMGRMAAELLFERLEGAAAPHQNFIVPVELFTRGTGQAMTGAVARSLR